MARQTQRLSARGVASLSLPGRHADGNGLYLVVDKAGAKRWVFLFRFEGRLREMGLGGLSSVPLSRARELATDARTVLATGQNPIDARKIDRAIPTFGACADQLLESMSSEWRNAKHRAQWKMTLEEYAKPLRGKPVDEITTEDVLKVLKPIWTEKPETASRLRGRIERVLDAAKALGHRSGENPALWRGHLKNLLPRRQKLTRGHHAAMPYDEVAKFCRDLQGREAVASQALRFCILTAARSGEVLGARWEEVDLKKGVWTVPAARMKAAREHRVPLTESAKSILVELAEARTDRQRTDYVFPGQKRGAPLSGMAMAMILRRMKVTGVTVHGFRSSFRDWAGECTTFPREVAEAALAHTIGDETERAYRRGDALEKRRKLMDAWAAYLGKSVGDPNVVARTGELS
jgi:integrase